MRIWSLIFALLNGRNTRALALAVLALAAGTAQAADASRFGVPLVFKKGRLAADCAQAKLVQSDAFRDTVSKRLGEAALRKQLCSSIDRAMREIEKPFYLGLTNDERAKEDAGKPLTVSVGDARDFTGPVAKYPLDSLQFAFSTAILPHLISRLPRISALNGPLESPDGASTTFADVLQFVVRDPIPGFGPDNVSVEENTTRPMLDPAGVSRLLAPLGGLPPNPEQIRGLLENYYASRGYAPQIELEMNAVPRAIRIKEARVAALLLPPDLQDVDAALLLMWSAAPYPVFRGFRRNVDSILKQEVDKESPFRKLDFSALSVNAHSTASISESLHAGLLQSQQAALAAAGYRSTLVDLGASDGSLGLAVVRAPVSDAAPPAEGLLSDAGPPATALAGGNTEETRKAFHAARDRRRFIGGGVDYKPGQGFRFFGLGEVRRLLGNDLLHVEAGAFGSGIGEGSYSRDFVGIRPLGMRMAVSLDGGTKFLRKRLLSGVATDERRTGFGGQIELEPFREWAGNSMTVQVRARRETVRLSAAPQDGNLPDRTDDAVLNVNRIEAGVEHVWWRRAAALPSMLRVRPSLQVGGGFGSVYRVFLGEAEWRQHISRRYALQVSSRVHAGVASSKTPGFDLPSLGGVESLRGFREDDALGRRYWSVQNELWIPLSGVWPGSGKIGEFVRRNVSVAPFADFGGISEAAPGSAAGTRRGFGIGPRVRYKGAQLGLDYGYGFGAGTSGTGRGRLYFSVRVL